MEVTTVFLVRFGHGDFASIDNIFSTREKAEERVNETLRIYLRLPLPV